MLVGRPGFISYAEGKGQRSEVRGSGGEVNGEVVGKLDEPVAPYAPNSDSDRTSRKGTGDPPMITFFVVETIERLSIYGW
jgi:hypothetical protein